MINKLNIPILTFAILSCFISCKNQPKFKKVEKYYLSGRIKSIEFLNSAERRDSVLIEYYDTPNIIHVHSEIKNGLRNGKSLSYYKNGVIESERFFVNDSLNGRAYFYYPNGSLETSVTYIGGKENGDLIEYYETNGKIRAKEFHVNGIPISHAYYYYPDGAYEKYSCYSLNGELGHVTFFNENGEVRKDTGRLIINYTFSPEELNLMVDTMENFRILYSLPPHCSGKAILILSNERGDKIISDMKKDNIFFSSNIVLDEVGMYKGQMEYSLYDSLRKTTNKERVSFNLNVVKK